MPYALNLWDQYRIVPGTCAAQCRIALRRSMTTVAGRGDLQYLADRLNPVGVAMLVDE